MTAEISKNQKRYRRRTLHIFSGYKEIQWGMILLIFQLIGVIPLFDNIFVPLGVIIIFSYILYYLIKVRILKPRQEVFHLQYQKQKKKQINEILFKSALAIVALVYLFAIIVTIAVFLPGDIKILMIGDHLDRWVFDPMIGSATILLATFLAYEYNSFRFFLLSILFWVSEFLPEELFPGLNLNFTLSIFMVVSGLIALYRFTRKYPLPGKDPQPQN